MQYHCHVVGFVIVCITAILCRICYLLFIVHVAVSEMLRFRALIGYA